jgi:ATP-dependent DNA ligase
VTFPPSTGPIEVTLTRPVDDIPHQCRTLEGQPHLAYELKIDGWRLVLSKTPAGAVELWSRRGRNLTAAFPELAAAALEH